MKQLRVFGKKEMRNFSVVNTFTKNFDFFVKI